MNVSQFIARIFHCSLCSSLSFSWIGLPLFFVPKLQSLAPFCIPTTPLSGPHSLIVDLDNLIVHSLSTLFALDFPPVLVPEITIKASPFAFFFLIPHPHRLTRSPGLEPEPKPKPKPNPKPNPPEPKAANRSLPKCAKN